MVSGSVADRHVEDHRRGPWLQDAVVVGDRDRLRATAGPELAQDVLDVCGDGLRADEQALPDLVVLKALRHELEHLVLSLGQPAREA